MSTKQLEGNPGLCVGSLGVWVIPGEGAHLIIRSVVQNTVVWVSQPEPHRAALRVVRVWRLLTPRSPPAAVRGLLQPGSGGAFTSAHSCVALRQDPFSQALWIRLAPPQVLRKPWPGKYWLISDSLTVCSSCKVPVWTVMFFRRKALKSVGVHAMDPTGGH